MLFWHACPLIKGRFPHICHLLPREVHMEHKDALYNKCKLSLDFSCLFNWRLSSYITTLLFNESFLVNISKLNPKFVKKNIDICMCIYINNIWISVYQKVFIIDAHIKRLMKVFSCQWNIDYAGKLMNVTAFCY